MNVTSTPELNQTPASPHRRKRRLLTIVLGAVLLTVFLLYPFEWKNSIAFQWQDSKTYYLNAEKKNAKKLLTTVPLAYQALEFLPLLLSISSENQFDLSFQFSESLAEALALPGPEPFGLTFIQTNGSRISGFQGFFHYQEAPFLTTTFLMDEESKNAYFNIEDLSSNWAAAEFKEWNSQTGIDLEAILSHQELIHLLSSLTIDSKDLKTILTIYTDFVLEQLGGCEPDIVKTPEEDTFANATISCSLPALFRLCSDFLKILSQNPDFLQLVTEHTSYTEADVLGTLASVRSLFLSASGKSWKDGNLTIVTKIDRRGQIDSRQLTLILPLGEISSRLSNYKLVLTAVTPKLTEGFELSFQLLSQDALSMAGTISWSGFQKPSEWVLPETNNCIPFSEYSGLITADTLLNILKKAQNLFGEPFYQQLLKFLISPAPKKQPTPSLVPSSGTDSEDNSEQKWQPPEAEPTPQEDSQDEISSEPHPSSSQEEPTAVPTENIEMNSGSKQEESEHPEPDVSGYPYAGYLTLGIYRGLSAGSPVIEVTEKELEEELFRFLNSYAYLQETDAAAKKGDTLIIDYSFDVSGLPFFSGEDFELILGSGIFPEELEQILYGASAGTVIIHNYILSEQAGLFAGFPTNCQITVNQVLAKSLPEPTDSFIREYTGYSNLTEFQDVLYKLLAEQKLLRTQTEQLSSIFSTILKNSVIHIYPQKEIQNYRSKLYQSVQAYASASSIPLEEYILSVFGISVKDFNLELDRMAEETILSEMVLYTVLSAEGYQFTEDMLPELLQHYMNKYQYGSIYELLQNYSEEELIKDWLLNQAKKFLLNSGL